MKGMEVKTVYNYKNNVNLQKKVVLHHLKLLSPEVFFVTSEANEVTEVKPVLCLDN